MKKHVSHVLTTLNLNNRVQIALLVHDVDLGDGRVTTRPVRERKPVRPLGQA